MGLTAAEIDVILNAKETGVEDLQRKLDELASNVGQVGTVARTAFDALTKAAVTSFNSVSSMEKDFSGQNIVKQAMLMQTAIENVGGVAKLTKLEQQQVNAVMAEAVNKLSAVGERGSQVSDAFKTLEVQTRQVKDAVADSTEANSRWRVSWTDLVAGITAAGILSQIVGTIKQWTVGAFTAADATEDMAMRFGLSTDTIQRFSFAAEQAGIPVTGLFKSVRFLSQAVAGGSDSVKFAIDQLGLSFEAVAAMSPEQRYYAVAAALKDVKSAGDQAIMSTTLMGRSGADSLGLINQGFLDVSSQAPAASGKAIAALSAVADSWDAFWARQKANTQEEIAGWVILFTQGVDAALAYNAELDKTGGGAGSAAEGVEALNEAMENSPEAMALAGEAAQKYSEAWTELESIGNSAAETIAAMDEEVVESVKHYLDLGASQSTLADAFQLTSTQMSVLAKEHKDVADKAKDHKEALEELKTTGEGWRGTVASIKAETVALAQAYLQAGASTKTVADGLQLTNTQMSAIQKSLKVQQQEVSATTKMWAEYEMLRVKAGGNSTEIAIAEIKRWSASVVAEAKKGGYATQEFLNAVAAVTKEKLSQATIDWSVLGQNSRSQLEATAERARATYEAMVASSGQFSAAAIANQREVAIAAEEAARNWRDSYAEAADDVQKKSGETKDKVIADLAAQQADRVKEADEERKRQEEKDRKNTFSYTIPEFTQTELEALRNQNSMSHEREVNPDIGLWRLLSQLEAKEGTYAPRSEREYLQMLREQRLLAQLRMWAENRERPAGLASGTDNWGGGDAWVGERGRELVRLPRGSEVVPNYAAEQMVGGSGSVVFGPGSIVINYPIMNDPTAADQFAEAVERILVGRQRRRGIRLGAAGNY